MHEQTSSTFKWTKFQWTRNGTINVEFSASRTAFSKTRVKRVLDRWSVCVGRARVVRKRLKDLIALAFIICTQAYVQKHVENKTETLTPTLTQTHSRKAREREREG